MLIILNFLHKQKNTHVSLSHIFSLGWTTGNNKYTIISNSFLKPQFNIFYSPQEIELDREDLRRNEYTIDKEMLA